MALPVAGGDDYLPFRPSGAPYYPAKRRPADAVDDDHLYHTRHKRPKYVQHAQFAGPVAFKAAAHEPPPSYPPLHHPHPHHPHHRYPSPRPRLPSPEQPAGAGAAPAMERTASGHSIRPDPTERCASTELLEDSQAAQRVRDHLATFRRRNPDSKHERILRSIINPRPRRHHHHHHHHHNHIHNHTKNEDDDDTYPLDNEALESIFSAANEIFFNGRLSQRVTWDWSHSSSSRYDSRVIGTTALRRAAAHTRGFETLIVLSSTILRDSKYSRRLLISTFLHELIHCYLFICCGFRARWDGGHTDGFREIAGVIDEWVGEGGGLYLRRVEADLELFRVGGCVHHEEGGGRRDGEGRAGLAANVYPCSGMAVEQEEYAAASAATAALPGLGTEEVAYFGGSGASRPGTGAGNQEAVYLGRPISLSPRPATPSREVVYFGRGTPSPRPGTPTREVVHYQDRGASGVGSSNNIWWRSRRAARPLYVYTGDEPSPSYVYADTMGQRP